MNGSKHDLLFVAADSGGAAALMAGDEVEAEGLGLLRRGSIVGWAR